MANESRRGSLAASLPYLENLNGGFFARSTIVALALLLTACTGNDPGPLKGTWQMTGPLPMKVTFRAGETEAMGMIEKVSYETVGKDVLVTYKDGFAKGTTLRYTMKGPDAISNELGELRRVAR